MSQYLEDPHQTGIHYIGKSLEEGPLPAFFYFSISGKESLELDPYNQPAIHLSKEPLRVFSFTIPGHEEGMNKFYAMRYWAEQMAEGKYILETFFENVIHAIEWLIEQKIVDPERMGVGGLSRGGFVATHIAARETRIHTLLGFAPITELMETKDFKDNSSLERRASELNLRHLADQLTHVRNFRYYIGNRDTCVSTDACYHFIRHLAEKSHEKHARHQKIELFITHSIGHQGHGTAPNIFEEGAMWTKNYLVENL